MYKALYYVVRNLLFFKTVLFGKFTRDNNLVFVQSDLKGIVGNCKYAMMSIRKNYPEKKIYWLLKDTNSVYETELEKHGVTAIIRPDIHHTLKSNFYHMYLITKAKYILTDGNFAQNYLSSGAIQIDFWHGTPLKKIRYDREGYTLRIYYKLFWFINRNNFMHSGSSYSDAMFLAKAARLPKRMVRNLGTPCIAPLVDKDVYLKEVQQNQLLYDLHIENQKFDRVYLYAPTFRDDKSDFMAQLHFDIHKLESVCRTKNIRFLVKQHGSCHLKISIDSDYIKVLDSSYDGMMCIAMCDVLVNDYSSMYYYAVVARKKIILMHGDIEIYMQNSRDIYIERLRLMRGYTVQDFNELCCTIENDTPIPIVAQDIVDLYWDAKNLQNPYRFLEVII